MTLNKKKKKPTVHVPPTVVKATTHPLCISRTVLNATKSTEEVNKSEVDHRATTRSTAATIDDDDVKYMGTTAKNTAATASVSEVKCIATTKSAAAMNTKANTSAAATVPPFAATKRQMISLVRPPPIYRDPPSRPLLIPTVRPLDNTRYGPSSRPNPFNYPSFHYIPYSNR